MHCHKLVSRVIVLPQFEEVLALDLLGVVLGLAVRLLLVLAIYILEVP